MKSARALVLLFSVGCNSEVERQSTPGPVESQRSADFTPSFFPSSSLDVLTSPKLTLRERISIKIPEGAKSSPTTRWKFFLSGDSIYAIGLQKSDLLEFDRKGNFVQYIGLDIPNELREKFAPNDVFFSKKEQRIYVAPQGDGPFVFTPQGSFEKLIELERVQYCSTVVESSIGDLLAFRSTPSDPQIAIFRNGNLVKVFFSKRWPLIPINEDFQHNYNEIHIDTDGQGNIYSGGPVDYEIRKYDSEGHYLGDFQVQSDPYYKTPPDRVEPGFKTRVRSGNTNYVRSWESSWTQVTKFVVIKNRRLLIVCLLIHQPRKYRIHFYTLDGRPALKPVFWDYLLMAKDSQDYLYFLDDRNSNNRTFSVLAYSLQAES